MAERATTQPASRRLASWAAGAARGSNVTARREFDPAPGRRRRAGRGCGV